MFKCVIFNENTTFLHIGFVTQKCFFTHFYGLALKSPPTFYSFLRFCSEGKMDVYCKNTHWLLRHSMFFLTQTFQHFYQSILRLLEVLKNSTQNYALAVKYPKPSSTLKDIKPYSAMKSDRQEHLSSDAEKSFSALKTQMNTQNKATGRQKDITKTQCLALYNALEWQAGITLIGWRIFLCLGKTKEYIKQTYRVPKIWHNCHLTQSLFCLIWSLMVLWSLTARHNSLVSHLMQSFSALERKWTHTTKLHRF